MISLFRRPDGSTPGERAERLYGRIVEQARTPAFYLGCGVPDTPDGRFDMIVLHAVLVLRRLRDGGAQTAELAQALFDVMFADMDENLREMGVGDLAVGKRIKAMAQGFYGRLAAYDTAIRGGGGSDLVTALRRNLYRAAAPTAEDIARMAEYVMRESRALQERDVDTLVQADFRFGAVPEWSGSQPSGKHPI
jgi:cytochrome b pre-mRNA-processing protein 3